MNNKYAKAVMEFKEYALERGFTVSTDLKLDGEPAPFFLTMVKGHYIITVNVMGSHISLSTSNYMDSSVADDNRHGQTALFLKNAIDRIMEVDDSDNRISMSILEEIDIENHSELVLQETLESIGFKDVFVACSFNWTEKTFKVRVKHSEMPHLEVVHTRTADSYFNATAYPVEARKAHQQLTACIVDVERKYKKDLQIIS